MSISATSSSSERALHRQAALAEVHIAALPFPTPQGTQAALRFMLQAAARTAGAPVCLHTYGACGPLPPLPFAVHQPASRCALRPPVHSGPGLRKLALDLQLSLTLRRRYRRPCPAGPSRVFVAHHVEAAWACLLAGLRPHIFVAHTDLIAELPCYFPPRVRRSAAHLGRRIDQVATWRALSLAAISPLLQRRWSKRHGRPVHYLPIVWPEAPPAPPELGPQTRQRLGLRRAQPLWLYAGNLDGYQGWSALIEALACSRKPPEGTAPVLLVLTASPSAALWQCAARAGVAHRLRVLPLRGETSRQSAYAAADVVLVPRLAPGGLPVKLLDALARGKPTVTMRRACAGLPLRAYAEVTDNNAPALATAALQVGQSMAQQQTLAQQGPRWIRTAHSAAAYRKAWLALLSGVLKGRQACQSSLRPPPSRPARIRK